jgi:ankyrin repeat protein
LAIERLQQSVLKALGRYTDPAWFRAAREGDTATIRTFIDRGVKIDARDEHDDTALTWAANSGHLEVVRTLIEAGADLNARQGEGATAMILAADKGLGDIVKALVEAGADVNAKHPKDRLGAIDFAARGGHLDLVHYLEAQGATWR